MALRVPFAMQIESQLEGGERITSLRENPCAAVEVLAMSECTAMD